MSKKAAIIAGILGTLAAQGMEIPPEAEQEIVAEYEATTRPPESRQVRRARERAEAKRRK